MGLDFSDLYDPLSLTTELVMRMPRLLESILLALPFAMPCLALAQGNAVGPRQNKRSQAQHCLERRRRQDDLH